MKSRFARCECRLRMAAHVHAVSSPAKAPHHKGYVQRFPGACDSAVHRQHDLFRFGPCLDHGQPRGHTNRLERSSSC